MSKRSRKLEDDKLAQRCFDTFCQEDPFPNIPAALLNSADIYDYVFETGMLCPFDSDSLKSASYEIKLLGKCVYWDENGDKQVLEIKQNTEFKLKPNSIAFVTLEPYLRIPDYIALRFNLKITHVYRGLLLGTGPLVDPGFQGRLSIPLHNLTTNEYKFSGGEGLIWMEFTKISPNQRWAPSPGRAVRQQTGEYVPFPSPKNQLKDVESYLKKAEPHRSIRSSISDALLQSSKAAKEAAANAKIVSRGAIFAIVTSIVALFALGLQVISLISDMVSPVREVPQLEKRIKQLEDEIKTLKQLPSNKNTK